MVSLGGIMAQGLGPRRLGARNLPKHLANKVGRERLTELLAVDNSKLLFPDRKYCGRGNRHLWEG